MRVAGVDDPAPLRHLEALSGVQGDKGATAQVIAATEELHPSRADHPLGQHRLVVGADRRLIGAFVQPGLRPGGLDPTIAQHARGHAVEGGGLVQPDEGVRVAPVPADAVAPVDQGHPGVGVVDQGVDEAHPHRPCTDHEIVDVHQAGHRTTQTRPGRSRQTWPRRVLSERSVSGWAEDHAKPHKEEPP